MDDFDYEKTSVGPRPGQRVFNRYTLTKMLGRGGMGVVWLAHDEELKRDTALKFLPDIVANDRASINDLKREVRRAIDLAHPHIVRIHDLVTDARTAAVSMEYVDGDTLSALKVDQPHQVFTPDQIGGWLVQLCTALDYAHQKVRVVHRDLKPANLMVDSSGDLKVLDFGIAASLVDSVSRVSQHVGSSGTPVYMSPQQMLGDRPTVTDDVYAVGATLYELLTGKPPFHSGNIIRQLEIKTAPSIATRRRELLGEEAAAQLPVVPEMWEQTIAACLAKEPADRPQSAGEIAVRLGLAAPQTVAPAPFLPSGSTQPPPPAPATQALPPEPPTLPPSTAATQPPPAPAPAKSSRAPLWFGVIAALLVLGGLGYYFGIHQPEQKRLAEIARLESEGRAAEALRLKNEQERADALAQEQADREQRAYIAIVSQIDAVLDGTSPALRDNTAEAVNTYLATAPDRFKTEVQSRWRNRSSAWEIARLSAARGALVVNTQPDGAEVRIGGIALETAPFTLTDQKLGTYPVLARLDGYEDWTGEVEIKENSFSDLNIALVRSTGSLQVDSVPSDLIVYVDGAEANRQGRTPVNFTNLPIGDYTVHLDRPGWPDLRREVTVSRNTTANLTGEFPGGTIMVDSAPSGAEVWAGTQLLGTTPLQLSDQAPGSLSLELRLDDYVSATTTAEVEAGETVRRSVSLSPVVHELYSLEGVWDSTSSGTRTFVQKRGDGDYTVTRIMDRNDDEEFELRDDIERLSNGHYQLTYYVPSTSQTVTLTTTGRSGDSVAYDWKNNSSNGSSSMDRMQVNDARYSMEGIWDSTSSGTRIYITSQGSGYTITRIFDRNDDEAFELRKDIEQLPSGHFTLTYYVPSTSQTVTLTTTGRSGNSVDYDWKNNDNNGSSSMDRTGSAGTSTTAASSGLLGVWDSSSGGARFTIESRNGSPSITHIVDRNDNEIFNCTKDIQRLSDGNYTWTYYVPSTEYTVTYTTTSIRSDKISYQWKNNTSNGTGDLSRKP